MSSPNIGTHVLKEITSKNQKRDTFIKRGLPDQNAAHEVVIAITQKNLKFIEAETLEIATPTSPRYQNWYSKKEIGELTKNDESAEAVRAWLLSEGVTITWESVYREYCKATASVATWERLLQTTFSVYEDTQIGSARTRRGRKSSSSSSGGGNSPYLFVRSLEYSLPHALAPHVFAIFNTAQVPPIISQKYHRNPAAVVGGEGGDIRGAGGGGDGSSSSVFKTVMSIDETLPSPSASLSPPSLPGSGGGGSGSVTVSFLDSYYKINSNLGSKKQNQSVFETSNEYFSQNDLSQFQSTYGLTLQAAVSIGGFETASCSSSGSPTNCEEGNLDIQYIMGVSQVTTSYYWYVGGSDPFTSWITEVAGEVAPCHANSISWGTTEQSVGSSQLDAWNTEAMKLAAMGVTITVSSGDNGVAGNGPLGHGCSVSACTANSGSSQSNWAGGSSWTGSGYFPSFPATSPYVTAVGATMGPESGSTEIACQSQVGGVITTGGGFSTYFARPSWQSKAVNSYFSQFNGSKAAAPIAGFNPLGRGLPDISLIGVKYNVIMAGATIQLYGTSCSSPVFAAYVSLLNGQRAQRNLTQIGWINPTLYLTAYNASFPSTHNLTTPLFNDITSGNNQCCAQSTSGSPICCSSVLYCQKQRFLNFLFFFLFFWLK